MRSPLLALVSAVALSIPAGAEARARPGPTRDDGSMEIRLRAQNGFYGLAWEVSVWRDGGGFFHRTTTVIDLGTDRRISETVDVARADALSLWAILESHHCWKGPKGKDWAVKDADLGTVRLVRRGREVSFNYSEFWDVADAIEKFGGAQKMRATARQQGLGSA